MRLPRPYVTRAASAPPVADAAAGPSLSLLQRVRDGLLGLDATVDTVPGPRPATGPGSGPGGAPGPAGVGTPGDLGSELAPMARRLLTRRPDAWAPVDVNEPGPDSVTTAALPVVPGEAER